MILNNRLVASAFSSCRPAVLSAVALEKRSETICYAATSSRAVCGPAATPRPASRVALGRPLWHTLLSVSDWKPIHIAAMTTATAGIPPGNKVCETTTTW